MQPFMRSTYAPIHPMLQILNFTSKLDSLTPKMLQSKFSKVSVVNKKSYEFIPKNTTLVTLCNIKPETLVQNEKQLNIISGGYG